MKIFLLSFVIFSFVLSSWMIEAEQAITPPRGWNSYDSFSWIISEQDFMANAEIISKRLHPSGYEYAVVDYLWYRKKADGVTENTPGHDNIDQWGRPQPDVDRWPSSKDGTGFTKIAKRVHDLGLKFGIHVMRGLSFQAYNANTLILDTTTGKAYEESGRQWRVQEIGLKNYTCSWMPQCFMRVNTESGAGKAFIRSLYQQYSDWGVDFVKHDCIFGDDLDVNEITTVSEFLRHHSRPIVYSLSPGKNASPDMAKKVNGLVNMYRITADDWDQWDHVTSHFDVSRDFANAGMIGAPGLNGKSWPDLDMLPLGWLTDPGAPQGPHRSSKLTFEEQKSQVTLWAMTKSPLMYGGDVRNLDDRTYNLITNPTILHVNAYSSKNREFPWAHVNDAKDEGIRAWIATGGEGEIYLAYFNLRPEKIEIYSEMADLAKMTQIGPTCKCNEVWSGLNYTTKLLFPCHIEPHGAVLLVIRCN